MRGEAVCRIYDAAQTDAHRAHLAFQIDHVDLVQIQSLEHARAIFKIAGCQRLSMITASNLRSFAARMSASLQWLSPLIVASLKRSMIS